MDHNEQQRTVALLMQMMNEARATDHKHIDFGEHLFHVRDFPTTAPNLEIFTERDDSWSIIWYIASFSGLIAFFLIVSCTEWCCRLHVRGPTATPPAAAAHPLRSSTAGPSSTLGAQPPEAPPPAYDLFAPPSYDSVRKGAAGAAALDDRPSEKSEYDVYVVPVHAMRMLQPDPPRPRPQPAGDDPPSYISVQLSGHNLETHARDTT